MVILSSPVNVSRLLQGSLELGECLFVDGFNKSRKEITVSCIASLDELELCESPIHGEGESGLVLVFSNVDSERLEKIESAVLIAPNAIHTNTELCRRLQENGTVVVAAANPRLTFIKALVEIEGQIECSSNVLPADDGFVEQGSGCVIKPGAIIGQAGFGFERDSDGTPIRFPHFGGVVMGINVEIGANTVISRGALGDTRIGDNTKIDDLVYIAHNCQIGSKVMIAGNATLCGGVKVADKVWIGAGAMVRQNIFIGEGAIIGMGAVVVKDVPPGATVMGSPAIEQTKSSLNIEQDNTEQDNMESAQCAV